MSISRNRDGFIEADVITDVNNIQNIAKVAKTNQYDDLDGKPDLSHALNAEQTLTKILSGVTPVGKATEAAHAANASFASSAGSASSANTAATATRATQDSAGSNILDTYAKKTGTYPSMSVGKATSDSEGNNIFETYAKNSDFFGVYDRIIRTQSEFDELIADTGVNSWNVAANKIYTVAFVGNGSSGFADFVSAKRIAVPSSVIQIYGFRRATIQVNDDSAPPYGQAIAFYPAGLTSSIERTPCLKGIRLIYSGAPGVSSGGFGHFANVDNCRFETPSSNSKDVSVMSAFASCSNMLNCSFYIHGITGDVRGFSSCRRVVNCIGAGWAGTAAGAIFYSCSHLSNCTRDNSPGNNIPLFGGTNTFRDDDSCGI